MKLELEIKRKESEALRVNNELEALKRKKAAFDSLPDNKKLAEALHEKLCKLSHEDMCSFFMVTWEGLASTSRSRVEYLDKADKILAVVDYDKAIKFVSII